MVLPWLMERTYGFRIITWRVSTMEDAKTGIFYYSFDDTPDEDVIEAVSANQILAVA